MSGVKILICVLAMGLIACAGAYADLADGLVGYWALEGNANDGSGMGNHGVIKGDPQTVSGMVGQALDFNGDDGIDIASNSSLELADALTCAAWIYPRAIIGNAAGNDHAGVCWKGNMIGWGADVYNWRIATALDAGLTWGSTGSGVEGYFATGNCFADGLDTWYHVALVEDGSEGRAYVNGVVLEDADVTGGDMHRPAAPLDTWPDEPVRIGWSQGYGGAIGPDTDSYFDGIIDEVVLYNRALSADEVAELMEVGLPATAVAPSDKLVSTWAAIRAE